MTNDRVTLSITDGVADVRLARPDKMNALDEAMFDALVETGERLRHDASVRAIVLSGEGKAFCAGLDMGRFEAMRDGGAAAAQPTGRDLRTRTHGIFNKPQAAVWAWRDMPAPVIAAVHGVAFGGGLQVALGADMRFVAPGTKMSVMEIRWGLVPDMGSTQIMRHLVRDDIVRDLVFTGRVFLAEEAVAIGIATRLCEDPRAEALAAARAIAGRNPHAIRAAKRLLNAAPYHDVAGGVMDESVEQAAVIGSKNQIEAASAELARRAPVFEDAAG